MPVTEQTETVNTLFVRFCAQTGVPTKCSALVTMWRVVIERSVTGVPTK